MRLLIWLLILAWPAFPQAMFFGLNGTVSGGGGAALITACNVGGGTGNANTTTAPSTGSINCSGATLIIAGIAYAGSPCTITDTSSNTYTLAKAQPSGAGQSSAVWYVRNPTTTGSMHFTCAGANTFPMINIMGFTGTATSGAPNATSSNGGATGTSVNAGPVAPSVANTTCVTELMTGGNEHGTPTISSPFTVGSAVPNAGGISVGGVSAYQIQTTATTENPTYSWPTSVPNAGAAACFP